MLTEPEHNKPRTAVLLRTHLANEKVFNLLNVLKKSDNYDLYISVDETHGAIDFSGYTKIVYKRELCSSIGLFNDRKDIFWLCGDYSLYFAINSIPDYDHYILVEYDVDFVQKTPVFLERLISKLHCNDGTSFDFLSQWFSKANPKWDWYDTARRTFQDVYNTGTFALIVISKKAIEFLYQLRKEEAQREATSKLIINCEAFCGSGLMMNGRFKCASFNSFFDGSVVFDSFHPPINQLKNTHYLVDYYKIDDPRVEVIHPAYEIEEYLRREYKRAIFRNEVGRFIVDLAALEAVHDRRELIIEYRTMATEKLRELDERSTEHADPGG